MDPQHLGFPDGFFGAVVAQYVFATVPDPEAALDEFARVTKAGGEIILVNHLGAEAGPRCVFERSIAPGAAGLAAGIPLAAAGAMGRAARRCARARTPRDAAARPFLADPLPAIGGGQKGRRSATRPGRGLQCRSRPSSSWRSKMTVVSQLFGDLSSCRASYFKQIPKA